MFDEVALPAALSLYIVLEALHFVFSFVSSARPPKSYELRTRSTSAAERLDTWGRCLRERTTTPEELITGWFYHRSSASRAAHAQPPPVQLDELAAGNVREWMARALCV